MEVAALDFDELSQRQPSESSADIKARVDRARAIQEERRTVTAVPCNARLGREGLDRYCALDEGCQALMKGAFERMGLTARSYDRILRVARTIADLDGSEAIRPRHLAEALQYRPPGGRGGDPVCFLGQGPILGNNDVYDVFVKKKGSSI